ncbi:hypothetical protein G6F68_018292 [Rhizopus microsporus]|nr:hypothetical protein G6F68_018292 [Rhizopus microsporus]
MAVPVMPAKRRGGPCSARAMPLPARTTHRWRATRISSPATTITSSCAVQDRYALKKSPTSASVGVGALGSVSLPFGSNDDSLVKVASSTVTDAEFYRRFFQRLQQYLPADAATPAPPASPVPATPEPAPASTDQG